MCSEKLINTWESVAQTDFFKTLEFEKWEDLCKALTFYREAVKCDCTGRGVCLCE